MLRKLSTLSLATALMLLAGIIGAQAQSIERNSDHDDYDHAKIDQYLDVEVWTDHYDGEYYEGDNIVINFRVNRDAFIAIYSIDTRGRVNLLFPADPEDENYIRGGATYSLPGEDDDYDLEVSGPEGFENIQIVASRERFPIPNWYHNSGLIADWDDRADYMDYLNDTHFVKYGGQRFAYDRAAVYVNEWEEEYYHPVYTPYYPSWTVYGNCYIDYPYGGAIYVNGIYWGCAPMYIPRLAIGWHTITIYDRSHRCWEHDFHVSRYNTVVFDRDIVRPVPNVRSKYKEVREVGYRDPVKSGYPKFKTKTVADGTVVGKTGGAVTKTTRSTTTVTGKTVTATTGKKYVRGSTKMTETSRGYETDASTGVYQSEKKTRTKTGSTARKQGSYDSKSRSTSTSSNTVKSRTTTSSSTRSTTKSGSSYRSGSTKSSSKSSGYYQKKSGNSSKARSGKASKSSGSSKKSAPSQVEKKSTPTKRTPAVKSEPSSNKGSSKKSSDSYRQSEPKSSSKSSGSVKSSGGSRSNSSSKSSSSGKSSSSRSSAGKGKSRR